MSFVGDLGTYFIVCYPWLAYYSQLFTGRNICDGMDSCHIVNKSNYDISAPAALYNLPFVFSLNVLPAGTHGFHLLTPSRHWRLTLQALLQMWVPLPGLQQSSTSLRSSLQAHASSRTSQLLMPSRRAPQLTCRHWTSRNRSASPSRRNLPLLQQHNLRRMIKFRLDIIVVQMRMWIDTFPSLSIPRLSVWVFGALGMLGFTCYPSNFLIDRL